jgi:hypothetical protein
VTFTPELEEQYRAYAEATGVPCDDEAKQFAELGTKPTPGTIVERGGKFHAAINIAGVVEGKEFDSQAAAEKWLEQKAEAASKAGQRVYAASAKQLIYRDTGITQADVEACPLKATDFASTADYVDALKAWSDEHGGARYAEREPDDIPREFIETCADVLGVSDLEAGRWFIEKGHGSSPEGRAAVKSYEELEALGRQWEALSL